jgi:hypothetical protein
MNRTALIAAVASIIPLAGTTFTAEADPYHRDHRPHAHSWGHGGVYRPVAPFYVPPRPYFHRFHFRRDWHPRPYWRVPGYWR